MIDPGAEWSVPWEPVPGGQPGHPQRRGQPDLLRQLRLRRDLQGGGRGCLAICLKILRLFTLRIEEIS